MHSFFINLTRRPDRRMQFETDMQRMGIDVERFQAIEHKVPAIGCLMSHLAVLKLARERNYERVCIFEDDFEFLITKEEYNTTLEAIPTDFDVVMLGWYIFESAPYNEVFGKVLHATTTSGYIVNRKFYDTLINHLETGVSLFLSNLTVWNVISLYSIDQYWIKLQPTAKWLHTLKRIGKQRAGFSDLTGTHVAYDY